jgi:hypothetical protein
MACSPIRDHPVDLHAGCASTIFQVRCETTSLSINTAAFLQYQCAHLGSELFPGYELPLFIRDRYVIASVTADCGVTLNPKGFDPTREEKKYNSGAYLKKTLLAFSRTVRSLIHSDPIIMINNEIFLYFYFRIFSFCQIDVLLSQRNTINVEQPPWSFSDRLRTMQPRPKLLLHVLRNKPHTWKRRMFTKWSLQHKWRNKLVLSGVLFGS